MKKLPKIILISLFIIFLIIFVIWYKKGTDKAVKNCIDNGYTYDFCISHV